jgi:hypothetical protein
VRWRRAGSVRATFPPFLTRDFGGDARAGRRHGRQPRAGRCRRRGEP